MLSVDFEARIGGFHLRPRFVAADELVVLFGPSGSGKSLTLRAIAGLLRPDRGRIELPGGCVFDSSAKLDLPPQARNVGYVVQDLALFPHLTVADNIAFALHGRPRSEQAARVEELLQLLGLQGLGGRLPRSISGGQQQRVALGRALAARPAVLLLDEPFSALDAPIRAALRREVAGLRRQLGLATLFVTHDLQEAFALADQIAVYDSGEVLQCGPQAEVFGCPASVRVAELLDTRNILRGRVVQTSDDFVEVETPWFRVRAQPGSGLKAGDAAAVCVRPEHVILVRPDRPHANELDTLVDAEVVDEVHGGTSHRLYLRISKDGIAEPCIIESDISAHPYEVMGVATRRDWRLAFTLAHTVALSV